MAPKGKRREEKRPEDARKDGGKDARRVKADESDLDAGYLSPIASPKDLSPKSIVDLLKNSRYAQLLLLLTIAGACLRLYNLTYNSLWLDEAATLDFARHSLAEICGLVAGGEFNPPLFYWIEHAMLSFGESEFVLRIIPAIAGILTIPVFYLLGREVQDRNTGLVAAALLAFSPFHLFYSQEARAYSFMLLLLSLAFLFFLRGMRSGELREWILFGIIASLSFWVHFYALVPVAILFSVAILLGLADLRKQFLSLKNAILSLLAFAILSLPLVVIAAGLFAKRTSAPPTYGIQGFEVIYQTLLQISGYNEFVMPALLILFSLGIISLLLAGEGGHASMVPS
ncbi:MAG: glycosyltransferase family 39 protein [Methanomicrobiales archaeon]|nr:glycosyltransferase family 39 protein [Methanomicrobiales archaeon]